MVTDGVIVSEAVAVFTPSVTETVCAPPGSAGTVASTAKLPSASVIKQWLFVPLVDTRLSTAGVVSLVPPLVVAHPPFVSHAVVEVPTVVEMAMAALGVNPVPLMTRVEPTVPDVTAVRAPLLIVDRDTVGVAACTGEAGSRNTIPAIPARNSNPIVPNEASLFVGCMCVCIYFTLFS